MATAMPKSPPGDAWEFTDRERTQVERANRSGRPPVVFIHGLWLLPTSWDRWCELFEARGYTALTPGWPDDPDTVQKAHAHPEAFAHKSVGQVAAYLQRVVQALRRKPVLVGHSFGGLLAQILAGRGLASVTVALDPAPFRGVLPLPLSALRSAWPVLGNPANWNRSVPLTFAQFRYAFANAVPEPEARELYRDFAVPASGMPIFQAAAANVNPWTEVRVDVRNPARGPLLVVSGERDHTVPRDVAAATYRLQRKNPGLTEFVEMPGRGHALTIDRGWREVAGMVLGFVDRFPSPSWETGAAREPAARA